MKRLKFVSLLLIMLLAASTAGAKTLKLAMDADPVSLDPACSAVRGNASVFSHGF